MSNRQTIYSGAKWEDIVGYSRAVRIGNVIEVSGTTSADGDIVIGKDDMYAQSICILEKIENALSRAGAKMDNVIRTRMFVTDIFRWKEAARAHAHYFKEIKPATTMVEIKALIHPDMLIEIEATAIV